MSADIREFPLKKTAETNVNSTNDIISQAEEEEKQKPRLPHEERKKYSDYGNAELFRENFKDKCIFVPNKGKNGCWMLWNGKNWEPDELGHVYVLAKEVVDQIEAISCGPNVPGYIKQHAIKSYTLRSRNAMVSYAKASMSKSFKDFDTDSILINVDNGILDLSTHELLPHDKDKFMTKIIPYPFGHEYADQCPRWISFLDTFMGGNQEMIRYLQKMAGYMMAGDPSEQCMFILYGNGRNGKSTFVNVLKRLMGPYSMSLPASSIMQQHGPEKIRNDLARLKGARLIDTSETQEGKKLDEPLLKSLTGGDTISARFLHQELEDFPCTGVMLLHSNYKPEIGGIDEGIWSRIRMVPCTSFIPEQERNRDLFSELLEEMGGILYWASTGYLMYKEEGLLSPDIVREATECHRASQDRYKEFIDEYCIEGGSVKVVDIYTLYRADCESNGEDFDKKTVFIEKMRKKYEVKKGGQNCRRIFGITLKP
jgi:putative DNA primase/helicase